MFTLHVLDISKDSNGIINMEAGDQCGIFNPLVVRGL